MQDEIKTEYVNSDKIIRQGNVSSSKEIKNKQNNKIPIIVGVTGHRNLVDEDIDKIEKCVEDALKEIYNKCGEDTPVIMLNAFAEGADILCAKVALRMKIDVYALLPCDPNRYVKSFDNKKVAYEMLNEYLPQTKRIIIAPDIERHKAFVKKISGLNDNDYEYRQMGICMASSCHILLALWDGKVSDKQFGCGTADVVKLALEQNYLSEDYTYRPGRINDCAVEWISVRRQNDRTDCNVRRVWLSSKLASADTKKETYCERYEKTQEMPGFISEMIEKTSAYNSETANMKVTRPRLWKNENQLDDYHKALRSHYIKADDLSYAKNQKQYSGLLFTIACMGTFIALFFTMYDDASIQWMIVPCTIVIIALILVTVFGRKRKVLEKYVEYRAMAEAIRIQFYASMILQNTTFIDVVCNLYPWTQKSNYSWIAKVIRSLAIINETQSLTVDRSEVVNVWLGENSDPSGQLYYHRSKIKKNRKTAENSLKISLAIKLSTIGIYCTIFVFELVSIVLEGTDISWFWNGIIAGEFSWRNLGVILVGTATAASLLFSGYFDKLSYNRKADDNKNMIAFYSSACERWKDVEKMGDVNAIAKFIKEVAREEIVENGIWCSYVMDNDLEIEI